METGTIRQLLVVTIASIVTLGCGPSTKATTEFTAHYAATLQPTQDQATVTLDIKQRGRELREITFSLQNELTAKPTVTSGILTRVDSGWKWALDPQGGRLAYQIKISHRRRGGGYDSFSSKNWALTRLDDLFPNTKTKSIKGSKAAATLTINTPNSWSTLTQYGSLGTNEIAQLDNETRTLPRPKGWMISGELGVRTDAIANRRITVAAPKGSGYPRVPMLAFLRWTLPALASVFPTLPARILIVSGDEGMWRGGLSGPGSLYLHKDRPLISENGTSAPLHELIHIATRWRAAPGDDWIVEGIAEYYSLKLLLETGGISQARFDAAIEELERWAKQEGARLSDPSKGANTAFAVLLFKKLDDELAAANKTGKTSFDDVIADLLENQTSSSEISRSQLIKSIEITLGHPSKMVKKYLTK